MPARPTQLRLLTLHFALFQAGAALAGGFIGAFLISSGFSLAAALAAYALYLALRSGLRFAALGLIRVTGYKAALVCGTALTALQFLPLMHADRPVWFTAWILCVAAGESLYWPLYHAAVAVTGDSATRGRQLGTRQMIATVAGVAGPLAGAWLLTRFGPVADFAVATLLTALSVLPLLSLRTLKAGAIPRLRETIRGADRLSALTFAADGWLSSGIFIAWPMVLFAALGSHYGALGAANAVAGAVGAAACHLCGRGIDRGQRDAYLAGVCLLLVIGCLMRSAASFSPWAAAAANLTGAAVTALYVPVVMSALYERARHSGAAFRFHFATEACWDIGAVAGCLVAALLALACVHAPSLVILPAMAAIPLVHRCVRADRPALTQAAPALHRAALPA